MGSPTAVTIRAARCWTDGSAVHPADPQLRPAAWSVVWWTGDAWSGRCIFCPGPQTAARAEFATVVGEPRRIRAVEGRHGLHQRLPQRRRNGRSVRDGAPERSGVTMRNRAQAVWVSLCPDPVAAGDPAASAALAAVGGPPPCLAEPAPASGGRLLAGMGMPCSGRLGVHFGAAERLTRRVPLKGCSRREQSQPSVSMQPSLRRLPGSMSERRLHIVARVLVGKPAPC